MLFKEVFFTTLNANFLFSADFAESYFFVYMTKTRENGKISLWKLTKVIGVGRKNFLSYFLFSSKSKILSKSQYFGA